jgi:soluble lytic murein transglycosylase-like protein
MRLLFVWFFALVLVLVMCRPAESAFSYYETEPDEGVLTTERLEARLEHYDRLKERQALEELNGPYFVPSPPAVSRDVKQTPIRNTSPPAGGAEAWRDLVSQYFPAWAVDGALNVLWCESRGDPNAYNPSGASGLFQIVGLWHTSGFDPFDPEQNIALAASIWTQGHPRAGSAPNWGHWVCQPDGSQWHF